MYLYDTYNIMYSIKISLIFKYSFIFIQLDFFSKKNKKIISIFNL